MKPSDFNSQQNDVNGPDLCPHCGETVGLCACPLVKVRKRKGGASHHDFRVAQHIALRRHAEGLD